MLVAPCIASADGGAWRLSERVAEYRVTVFIAPSPPRVGSVDVSVLVQEAATGRPRTDVAITVAAHPADEPRWRRQREATTDAATNKLFRAVQFDLPEAGTWRIEVAVAGVQAAPVAFDMDVSPPLPSWVSFGPWIAWPGLVVVLFLIHQVFAGKRAQRLAASRKPHYVLH